MRGISEKESKAKNYGKFYFFNIVEICMFLHQVILIFILSNFSEEIH